jgi:hypothetical protein
LVILLENVGWQLTHAGRRETLQDFRVDSVFKRVRAE